MTLNNNLVGFFVIQTVQKHFTFQMILTLLVKRRIIWGQSKVQEATAYHGLNQTECHLPLPL